MKTGIRILTVVLGIGAGMSSVFGAAAAPPSSAPVGAAAAAKTADPRTQYVIVGGDRITISVTGQVDLNASVTISSTGTVSLKQLDNPVKLSGLTVAQAEQEIEDQYINNRILKRPQVIVTIEQASARYVYVTGETTKKDPILYPMDTGRKMKLVELIQKAGVTGEAKLSRVTVYRKKTDGTIQTLGPLDVESYMTGKSKSPQINIDLEPDDTVDVPMRTF